MDVSHHQITARQSGYEKKRFDRSMGMISPARDDPFGESCSISGNTFIFSFSVLCSHPPRFELAPVKSAVTHSHACRTSLIM